MAGNRHLANDEITGGEITGGSPDDFPVAVLPPSDAPYETILSQLVEVVLGAILGEPEVPGKFFSRHFRLFGYEHQSFMGSFRVVYG